MQKLRLLFLTLLCATFGFAQLASYASENALTSTMTFGQPDFGVEDVNEGTLYSNGPFYNFAGSPNVSMLQDSSLGMTIFGFGHALSTGYRVADDWVVEDNVEVESFQFYAYQTGSTTTSTINHISLAIWDGDPSNPSSSIIWGDQTTNVISTSTWSGAYRQLESSPGTTDRPIMITTVLTPGLTLEPGTYWLDWNSGGTLGSGPWAPAIAIAGESNTGNGKQFDTVGWVDLLDINGQGLPFEVNGSIIGGPSEGCDITVPGGLEDGLGALQSFMLANDFNIAAGETMTVEKVTVNTLANVATVNVSFYQDNAGAPGAQIMAPVSIVPTSQTYLGTSDFGANIYALELDLPTAQVFDGGASGANFWLGITTTTGSEGQNNYWEFSTSLQNGTYFHYSSDGGATWADAGDVGFFEDGSFILEGTCGGEPPAEDCDITVPGSLEDGLGALQSFMLANDFNIAAGETMSVEKVTINTLSNVSTVNVSFHQDNAGAPGTQIMAPVSIVPTSQTLLGTTEFGFNIYALELDLPTAQVFDGGASGTNFWLGITTTTGSEGQNNYWEFSTSVQNGTYFHYSSDGGATWADAGDVGFFEDGSFILEGTCGGEVDPPSDNDECDGAIAIACGETMTGTTADATDSGANASADRFYSFTSSGTPEEVTISLCGSAYDTYLRVFTDCTLSNEVAFNDDFCGVQSELSFVPDVNTTYYIMVEGWSTNTGTYTISVSCDEPFIVEEPDYPCFQGDGMNSNNFENGYNVTAGGTFRNADDFTVDNTFSLQYVRLNLFMIPGTTANSATFNIRADEGGAPSESNIVSTINATPTSQVVIGNNFGYDISQVEFILDTPVDFSAGTYWLQPEVNSDGGVVFWEVTTTGSNGGLVHTSESGGAWNQDPDGFQGVFFVAGVCDDNPPPVDCSQETPSNSFENGHGNLHMLKVANDFNVEINESFTVEQFKFNVILPAGATVDALDYYFYEDTGSGPGNEVDNTLFASPTSVEFVGNLSSFEVYTVTVDLDTPVVLNGSTSGDTAYWLGMMIYTGAANSYWEGTSVINTANEGYLELDGVWAPISTTFGSEPFDGVMEISGTCATLGVSDMTSFDFAYYPNPVKDILNITSDKNIENVSVFNLAGQQVMTSAKVNNGQINVTALPAGVYVFKATLQGGQVETFKIIKK